MKKDWFENVQDALDRMNRASIRGTGCNLTADMMDGLRRTIIGSMWSQDRIPVNRDCNHCGKPFDTISCHIGGCPLGADV